MRIENDDRNEKFQHKINEYLVPLIYPFASFLEILASSWRKEASTNKFDWWTLIYG